MFRIIDKHLFVAILILAGFISAATITIDGNGAGRTFEGLGICSSNGCSDLLPDYDEPYRSDILDFLFKPKFGASIQHLKVEIGCGDNTTQGSEASVAITQAELSAPVDRGYESWLIKEAVKRKPTIMLGALAWGYPGWVGWYNQSMANYYVGYLNCLKNAGVNFYYIGFAKNEANYDRNFVVNMLRPTMNQAGFSNVKLVGPDMDSQCWLIFNDFDTDPTFANMIYAAGYHYDWDLRVRAPTDKAKNSGKPLWSNEHHCYVWNPWQNAMYCARGNNGNYIDDKITCTLNWLGLDAAYAGAGFFKYTCLLQADQPQSGYYLVQPMTWAYAHTTQFTEIGWKYLDAACGQFVPGNRNGTYVTLRDTGSNNWSTIITTQAATSLTASIAGGLSTGTVYVWKSDSLAQFIQQPSITPANGSFTISLAANSIYTLTTTTGQHKGSTTIPASKPFPFPYSENYERYAVGDCLPRFHSDQRGTFEVYQSPDGRKCLRQIVPGYGNLQRAITAIGNNSWTDYDVVVDAKIDSGEVEVGGHYADYGKWCGFSLNKNGAWRMHDIWDTTVARGTVSGFNGGMWHTMRVSFKGTTMQAFLDNTSLGSGTQTSKPSGLACLASTRNPNLFDNLYIGPQGTYTGIQASPGGPARDMLSIRRVAGALRVAITYAGDDRNPTSVDIYDMRGQRVRALASGRHNAGVHTIMWDGKNNAGGAIGRGNYLIRLETAGMTMAQRICIGKNME